MADECLKPSPVDIIAFLPYACYSLGASFSVQLKTRIKEENIEKAKKIRKDKSTISTQQETGEPESDFEEGGAERVAITACFNPNGRLVELQLLRTPVPTLLLRVLMLCLPYQPHLACLRVRRGEFDNKTIAEISQLLPQSQITELFLDDSPNLNGNYGQLLAYQTHLHSLSLDRCGLNDDDCIEIAAKLNYPYPASQTLLVLSMSSNLIFNSGAAALAETLRSNRKLRHLNLAGNRISNTGAAAIFSSLMEFPLTCEEVVSKRLRGLQYMKLHKEVYTKCYIELMATSYTSDSKSEGRRKGNIRGKSAVSMTAASLSADEIAAKANAMTTELIGPNNEPFNSESMFTRDSAMYSYGNLCLCYLNISYNNLGHPSVVKLAETIEYQQIARAQGVTKETGLVRVQLDGNPLPANTDVLDSVQAKLDSTILSDSKGRKISMKSSKR